MGTHILTPRYSALGFAAPSSSRGGGGGHAAAAVRGKPKEMVLGNPSVTVEKGKYSYDVETLINKLSSLPPRGSIARCLDAFRNRLSLADFALVFKEFALRSDWQRSLRLFKYMQRQLWCKPNEPIYALMLGILGREGLLDKCSEVFEEMPTQGVPRSALSFTALINSYGRNGQHEVTLHLLGRMKRERVAPTVLTYNTVLAACARGGLEWEGLLGLFAQMRHDGVRPDIATYNTLLSACASRGLSDQAETVFRAMNEAGVLPDVATHKHLVSAFEKVEHLEKVSELLAEMESSGNPPDVPSYNVLVEAHARSGSVKEAVAVLRQMQRAGCAPDASTYGLLLDLYGRHGRYEEVRGLFLEMKAGGTEADAATYNVLIGVFGEGGYFREVVTLFDDMIEEKVKPDMETYEGLIYACGKGGLHGDARRILLHMQGNGIVPSAKAYTGVIEAFGQAALYEEAIVAFNTMQEIGSVPTIDTYNSLINMFSRGGLYKEAQVVCSRMNEADVQRNDESFNALIEAFSQGGQYEEALKTYVDMQKVRCSPNQRTLEAILYVYCSAGLVEESRETFLEIKESGAMPTVDSYCLLLSVFARSNRLDDAHELLDEMRTNRASNAHQVIGTMIKGEYDDDSNWQMVEYVFDKFVSDGCGSGLRFYNALLDALWWLGQKARAARVLSEATKRALFPELFRHSKLVWSADVHRMSVGGALTALSIWLNDMHDKLANGDDLPQLASIVVVRGVVEKSKEAGGFPVARAVYSFVKEQVPPSFSIGGWNKGRIVCHRSQLKRIFPLREGDRTRKVLIQVENSSLHSIGTTRGQANSDDPGHKQAREELMQAT
ncbi:pentatricopeptide repeat-containing protein At1g74850, chloroplastic isoform X2 [Amborella trichopoda]|uniref:pentatricopeptide repeat-containing protein At1g74850, chloroplastic isoform X2 n=1 Tax=Amborella trichopoda TaxID=13333 RepID=UPI0009BF37F7|nr:pentatricopeptide repeat-containing protein At1g74850, chloroplastic isoform X2 [Amborella trichopoda]|eukprot:XP_020522408.1 pentatricopeptide repeat-containing protein At1g74850, chloroplastic isoform X2 [Amborella trichopoda]